MNESSTIKQFLAVRAFIMHEGKVLIIRESEEYIKKRSGVTEQKYDLPGGKIKPGEKYQDAILREIKEECALDVEIGRPFFHGEWRPIIKGEQIQILGIFFECHAKHANVTLSPDHDQYLWIEPKEYTQYKHLTPNDQAFEAYLNL